MNGGGNGNGHSVGEGGGSRDRHDGNPNFCRERKHENAPDYELELYYTFLKVASAARKIKIAITKTRKNESTKNAKTI
ncbi:MAG: hypothetical protein K8T89_10845 [Planctomycetes bacterium]|nr:hypothetical protein [Planctomycetota bacterium]